MVRIILIQTADITMKDEYFLHSEYWSAVLVYNGQSPWRARSLRDKRWRLSERRPASRNRSRNRKEQIRDVNLKSQQLKEKLAHNFNPMWHIFYCTLLLLMWATRHVRADNEPLRWVTHRLHTLKLLSLLDLLQPAHILHWLLLKVLPHGFHLEVCL